MSQISPPMRIALAVAVIFGAAYMLVLKPKDEAGTTTATTPAATQVPNTASATDENKAETRVGKAVEAARGAAAKTEAKQNSSSGSGTSATQSKPSTSSSSSAPETAAESAEAPAADASLASLPKWLQKSMDNKVVAILFSNGKSADDRRTRKALKQAYTAHGKVVKRTVPISEITKYRAVAEGVDVAQSPTLMVIDRARSAQSLVGYSNVSAVNQAIIDGLLATDNPVKRVKYLQTVQRECRQIVNQAILGENDSSSSSAYGRNVAALLATMSSSLGTLRNAPVPAAYKGVSGLVTRYLASEMAAGRAIQASAIGKRFVDSVKVRQINARNSGLEHRTLLELNAVGVDACN